MTSSTTSRQLIPPGIDRAGHAAAVEVALELAADLRARAVQQHALVALGELERRADLVGVPALDVAQGDDLLLAAGSGSIASRTSSQRLGRRAGSPPGSRAQACGGIAQPPGYIGWSARQEAVRVDGGLVLARSGSSDESGTLRCSRSPRVRARLATIRRIQVFSVERPSKRSRPLEDAEPGLLDDLLGDGAACARASARRAASAGRSGRRAS